MSAEEKIKMMNLVDMDDRQVKGLGLINYDNRLWIFNGNVLWYSVQENVYDFSTSDAQIKTSAGYIEYVKNITAITPYLGIITIIYFILGYLAYALLYALTGSTVSKPEDIQSANGPVAMLAVIGFYLSYFTMMNPTSSLNVFASIFPISSPFCMPFRIMMGLASTTDVLISIAVLIITILVIAKVTIKIYSNAILNYGTKMGIKDIMKMYKDKNN